MEYRELYEANRWIITWASTCANAFHRQNYDKGIRVFKEILEQIQRTIGFLMTNHDTLQQDGITIDTQYIMQLLKDLMQAQEQQDNILMGDLLELTIVPFCIELQVTIQGIYQQRKRSNTDYGKQYPMKEALEKASVFTELYSNYWKRNVDELKKHNPELLHQLEKCCGQLFVTESEGLCFQTEEKEYWLEETQCGYFTLRIVHKNTGRSYYMHSNKNALEEAEFFADTYTDAESESYHILGMGLSYHWGAIVKRTQYAKKITVYETDPYIIMINLMVHDITATMSAGLTICYDPDLRLLSKNIIGNESGFIIHYPSIANIEKAELRRNFEKFFIIDNSFRNHKEQLIINFQTNNKAFAEKKTGETIGVVDDILDRMEGKTVCIIAAGPSLDKNISQLLEYRKKRDDLFILATGTVLRKLTKMGFEPDAVIFTDSNQRIINQLGENEKKDFPILLLSTAYFEFMRKYCGPRYIIYQEGFPKAEKQALESGFHLYKTGGSVSTTALDIAIQAHAEKIIFLGFDLAFTNDLAHATDTSNTLAADKNTLIPVKGYYTGTVLADQKFIIYREWIEKRIQESDAHNIKIINATEGGSYLKGAIHQTLKEALEE